MALHLLKERILDPRLGWALTLLASIMLAGTFGYMWIEDWTFWRALFFTVISVTTVGYGDYGLSPTGERFTVVLLIVGIGTVSFAASRSIQLIIERQLKPERRMLHQIVRLDQHQIICGLGRIGQTVCERLAMEGVDFVAVDANESGVAWARDHGMIALVGDATEDVVLEQCGVNRAKGLTAVTSSDAANTVITLSAVDLNPDLFVLARAETPDSVRRLKRAGASRVISPVRQGAISVAEAIMHPHAAEFLGSCADNDSGVVFAEVEVAAGSLLEGKTIRECGAEHPELAFVAIQRPDKPAKLHPPTDRAIAAGDVLIIAGRRESVRQLESVAAAKLAA